MPVRSLIDIWAEFAQQGEKLSPLKATVEKVAYLSCSDTGAAAIEVGLCSHVALCALKFMKIVTK